MLCRGSFGMLGAGFMLIISEMHGATMADIDGDRIPDFVTGKRLFSHQESWVDPDPYGDAVLYWFRTVRNARARAAPNSCPS